ncbi:malate dehydrogenase (quinone) [Leucothrix mucor]|uniref:malate dehydrogenase (quinone) n=1 Tax=Leucothrix mucor TaxID=45248 RepID=UPI0003B5D3D8|nr:malate dehydrogenase (quinone) [Leucothrix mucor]
MIDKHVDVLLVGAGAMSSTLATLLNQLDPNLSMMMVERLDKVAEESTSGWNNAGTGHAAYCELNYTSLKSDGSMDTGKPEFINPAFEFSLQFWSYLVGKEVLPEPTSFINPAPHMSFVWGEGNVNFLRKRYEAMKPHHLFKDMEYSEDHEVLREWMPLVMEGRSPTQQVAATRVRYGSDVDFGAVSRYMVKNLQKQDDFDLLLSHNVVDLYQREDGEWQVHLRHTTTDIQKIVRAKFVFLGGGGGALPLLQKSGIPEAKGYGGFPVSGQWLVCHKPEVVERHHAKVYGKASIGAPPMSVPHLDTRIIDGKKALLFGPFAGFTTKFLKQGSFLDLIKSVRPDNLVPMLSVARDNMDLTRYLIKEVKQSFEDRMDTLRLFYKEAKDEDWELSIAGQRVQIIKRDPVKGGKLEFGTEVVSSADGSLVALLGASPGASTAVQTMVKVLEKSFPEQMTDDNWVPRLQEMVPSYGGSLDKDAELLHRVRKYTLTTLKLDDHYEN